MKIGEHLYFSPNYKFTELRWDDKSNLIPAFQDRVTGFYLDPVDQLNNTISSFAAGVLCVTTIDFLAAITTGIQKTGVRIENWLKSNISTFDKIDPNNKSQTLARRFYNEFRNGLVHEGRIKEGGQFSYDFEELVQVEESVMVVNPMLLATAIREAFKKYIEKVKTDEFAFQSFKASIIQFFRVDIEIVKPKNTMVQNRQQ